MDQRPPPFVTRLLREGRKPKVKGARKRQRHVGKMMGREVRDGKCQIFNAEMEIIFNEEEAEATTWTESEPIYRQLIKRLGRPHLAEDGDRHAVFKFPKEFISLPRLKAQKSLTPTQRAQLASRLSRSPQNVGEKRQSGVSMTKPETDNGLIS